MNFLFYEYLIYGLASLIILSVVVTIFTLMKTRKGVSSVNDPEVYSHVVNGDHSKAKKWLKRKKNEGDKMALSSVLSYHDDDGNTMLLVAVSNLDKEMVEILVKAGCDVDQTALQESGPRFPPVGFASVAFSRAIENIETNDGDDEEMNRTEIAEREIEEIAAEIANILIQAGANMQQLDAQGGNSAIHAAQVGSPLLLKAVLAAGAEADKPRTIDGVTALFMAASPFGPARSGHVECTKILLAAGANPMGHAYDKATPLLCAVKNDSENNAEIVRLLLDRSEVKAGIDQRVDNGQDSDTQIPKSERGTSPLIMAVEKGFPKGVELLLDAGADTNAVFTHSFTGERFSALTYAIVCYLEFSISWMNTTSQRMAIVKTFLSHNSFNPSVPDCEGFLPIVMAVSYDPSSCFTVHMPEGQEIGPMRYRLVEALLQAGAQSNEDLVKKVKTKLDEAELGNDCNSLSDWQKVLTLLQGDSL